MNSYEITENNINSVKKVGFKRYAYTGSDILLKLRTQALLPDF